MAKIELYREYVKQVIRDHARHQLAYGEIEVQAIFDTEGDHYQLVHAGWHKKQRQYGCLIHIDIKDEKIWIQYDGTEVGWPMNSCAWHGQVGYCTGLSFVVCTPTYRICSGLKCQIVGSVE